MPNDTLRQPGLTDLPPIQEWTDALMTKKDGGFLGNLANALIAFRQAPRFAGNIHRNIRTGAPWSRTDTPAGAAGAWTDSHITDACGWLQQCCHIPVKRADVFHAVGAVAADDPFDPVAEWLRGHPTWDGTARVAGWLHTYLGAVRSPLNDAIGTKFLVGAVARGIRPGVQMDNVLILEGPQDIKKSSAVRVLAGQWGGESLPDFHSKDAVQVAATAWIIEISELTAMNESSVAHMNAFITRRHDTVRLPYDKFPTDQPRGCVFIGTVNPLAHGYLRDPTGSRRFWPVAVGVAHDIDLVKLEADLPQLYAEALALYDSGDVKWWPDTPTEKAWFAQAQDMRYEDDPLALPILRKARSLTQRRAVCHLLGLAHGQVQVEYVPGGFTMEELIEAAFPDVRRTEIDRRLQTRVGMVLTRAAYVRRGRDRRYMRLEA
jgi:hypothetical protein